MKLQKLKKNVKVKNIEKKEEQISKSIDKNKIINKNNVNKNLNNKKYIDNNNENNNNDEKKVIMILV